MTVQVHGQELTLSGTVGDDWFGDGFTHAEVVAALAPMEGDITVHLNSGGGIAAEGAAIYATLSTYDGDVNVVIDGIAASAASLIAMAGDTITMSDGAVMMIHDPMNITIGNSADHAKTIEQLEAYAKAYARAYAKRSGKTADECREIMKAETWFDGEHAVEAGFADEAGQSKAKPVAAYDYRAYAHAPKRFVAQAKAKDWSIAKHLNNEAAASAVNNMEVDMTTDKERADALAAELATLKAEKAAAEAKAKADLDAATAATAAAVMADRDRRAAIMALDEAKGRQALAEVLFADGADVEKAKAYLAAAPVAAAPNQTAADYEANRLSGAELGGGGDATADAKASWARAVARANKRNKK